MPASTSRLLFFARPASAAVAAALLTFGPNAAPKAWAQGGVPSVVALVDVKIAVAPGKVINKGIVVVRDGLIVAVGENVQIPADAQKITGANLTVYPGFVDAFSHVGMPTVSDTNAVSSNGGADPYYLSAVQADKKAENLLRADAAQMDGLRRLGFGSALAVPQIGIFSGESALVSLAAPPSAQTSATGDIAGTAPGMVIKTGIAQHLNFDGPKPTGGYPNSLMGEIAVARQTLYDAQNALLRNSNYEKNPVGMARPVSYRGLTSLGPAVAKKEALVVHANSAQEIRRVLKFAAEFDLTPTIDGGEEAYRVVPELKAARATVLLSTALPTAPRVAPGEEDTSTLQGLRRRALAPTSASALAKGGVPFALTTDGVTNLSTEFAANVRKMISAGLTEDQAVEALTIAPARILGVDKQLGTVEVGKIANLVVTDGPIFGARSRIRRVFVDGREVDLDAPREGVGATTGGFTAGGAGTSGGRRPGVATPGAPGQTTPPNTPGATVTGTPAPFALPPGVTPEQARQFLLSNPDAAKQFLPPNVTVEQALASLGGQTPGTGENPSATQTPAASVAPTNAAPLVGTGLVPPLPPAIASSFVLRNATVWTVGPQGVLPKGDVYVSNGKISAVGVGLKVPTGTTEIDATNKHVSPGMIDCHSHTAIEGGVNEGTNIVTAECRIADVIDAEDVNIYRQLAGGTTAANVLHGSANAIGGQNAVVKWRWGKPASELMFSQAPQGIKFALGENPKQSNFTRPNVEPRYPTTRMGVEKVIRNEFVRAQNYQKDWDAYKAGKTKVAPRRDLQLDAIVEILNGKRLVHSHSYRQDEILMLLRVAEEFDFRVATFQHVLEGYKVADELAAHGAGGSTFSDWWAFKIEAWDAIPYNGALMEQRGVVTSFNSDSSELARRLNLEAAKAVHWGGLSKEEAIKFLTINPAKQLRIDKYVGSLEAGKDADIVVWSGDPLSSLTVCEKTFVDGQLYFDRQADLAARPGLESEKKRLSAALNTGASAAPATTTPGGFRNRPGGGGGRFAGASTPGSENAPAARQSPSGSAKPEPVAPVKMAAARAFTSPLTVITGATVHPVSGPDITDGVVVMQNGKIVSVGDKASVPVPSGATVVDATGLHVYPGLIDADNEMGLTEIESIRATVDSRETGPFSPDLRTAVAVNPDSELIPVARQNGVLNAVAAPSGGTISGMGALLNLDGWTWEDLAVSPTLGMYVNFPTLGQRRFREVGHRCEETAGSGSDELLSDPQFRSGAFVPAGSHDTNAMKWGLLPEVDALQDPVPATQPAPGQQPSPGQIPARPQTPGQPPVSTAPPAAVPPGSPLPTNTGTTTGSDTVLRPLNSFLEDARRYAAIRASEANGAPVHARDEKLEALIPVLSGQVPVFVRADRDRDIRAAVAWAKRENFKMVLVGGQEADKAADLLARENVPVILGPVTNLPARFDAPYDDPYTLPARLAKAGVKFCFSTGNASESRRLPYQAAMAASYGLPQDEALKALTLGAAQILGMEKRLGSIEAGKDANLIITTGNPLEIVSVVKSAFIEGKPVDMTTKQTRLYDKYRNRPQNAVAPKPSAK